ncbi:MAG: ABC transporter permease [Phycisphaerae bacterium]
MIRACSLMFLFARVSVQNFAAYRFDFAVRFFVSLVHLFAELIAIWTIFSNTQTLRGWEWQHMLVLVGVFRIIAGGIRISIVPNMHRLLTDIREGTLDFVLLQPVNAQFLVSIREFVFWRIADVILGATAVVWGCVSIQSRVGPGQVLVFIAMLAAGFVIVYSIWLMLATLCFWFVRIQNIEMVFWNVFEAGRFPIVIYRPWIRWTLTFVLPLAFITTFPAGSLFGDPSIGVPPGAPLYAGLIAVVSLLAASRFWRYGLRHYSGASA